MSILFNCQKIIKLMKLYQDPLKFIIKKTMLCGKFLLIEIVNKSVDHMVLYGNVRIIIE